MITAIIIIVVVLLVIAISALSSSIRVLREYERGVVFRLGRLMNQRGPGLLLLIPSIDRMVRVSLRTITLRVPPQEIITRDNIPVRVTAVCYYRVIDPSTFRPARCRSRRRRCARYWALLTWTRCCPSVSTSTSRCRW
jgi:regulator of protease activity HflC (stomatin/prohibitin superfamily)